MATWVTTIRCAKLGETLYHQHLKFIQALREMESDHSKGPASKNNSKNSPNPDYWPPNFIS